MRENPDLKLVVLAKHGLVVWGDTAEEAYRRTIEVINRAVEFVNAQDGRQAERFDGAGARRAELDLRAVLPALRGAVSSERHKVLVVDTSPRAREFVSSRAAPELVDGRRRLPRPPRPHQARAAVDPVRPGERGRGDAGGADPRAGGRVTGTTTAPYAGDEAEPADPDARVVLIQHVGLVGVGADDQGRRSCRATSTTARSRSWPARMRSAASCRSTRRESFAIEYWPLELYKLSLAPPPGELQGQVALVTGAAGRHRPRDRRLARLGRRLRRRLRPRRTRDAAGDGLASPGT